MSMAAILDAIVEHKKQEISRLYTQFDVEALRAGLRPSAKNFYARLAGARTAGQPFFIAEFKRKSPSEGWINQHADLPAQIRAYAQAGAGAISVLTDTAFFGGSYADLEAAAQTLADLPAENRPLLLQKDFVLDPVQIYLARQAGADLILLIVAILEPGQLEALRHTAESLGMGALVEVHDQAELEGVQHFDFPALGINNRDLKTFRTALNRVNVLSRQAQGRFVISESGIHDYRDFQVVKNADGFLIGASLMRNTGSGTPFQTLRSGADQYLFKACGIRTADAMAHMAADYLGFNFSPLSKRRVDEQSLRAFPPEQVSAVAVFYQNTEAEIREILARYPFKIVQLYAGDVSPEFVRSLKQKVVLACRLRDTAALDQLETYAADVDFFILDGPAPGSGARIDARIPPDFPYPFLLAGGLHAGNLDVILDYQNCIGVDIASGIETDGRVDRQKIETIAGRLKNLRASVQEF